MFSYSSSSSRPINIGKPNDRYEQEADRVADQVVQQNQPANLSGNNNEGPPIQRKCNDCEEEELQMKTLPAGPPIQRKCADCEEEELQMKAKEQTQPMIQRMGNTTTPNQASQGLHQQLQGNRGRGATMAPQVLGQMENSFAQDFSQVRIHTGGEAIQMNQDLNARAFTHGQDIYFNRGQYQPQSTPGQHLLAHELTHVVQQKGHSDAIQRKVDCTKTIDTALTKTEKGYESYAMPGNGRILPISAALHPNARQYRREEHDSTCADLPKGTPVIILGTIGKWTYVHTLGQAGFVSQELISIDLPPQKSKPSLEDALDLAISFTKMPKRIVIGAQKIWDKIIKEIVEGNDRYALKVDPTSFKIKFTDVNQVFVLLKRAEKKYKELDSFEKKLLPFAKETLEATGKYNVESSYAVKFIQPKKGGVKIDTIQDFILFVEAVERAYPSATEAEIVGEIRQIWFSDVNWELLVNSRGITSGSSYVDIETQAPIATAFDMGYLAPTGKEKQISTPMGSVAISHVIAGIDATINGSPTKAQATAFATARGHGTPFSGKNEFKYDSLIKQNQSDPRDFATWSGDLGQAYAEYLVSRYIDKNKNASLPAMRRDKSSDAQLLADIHGYIINEVWTKIPYSKTPETKGQSRKVSDLLRDLYLIPKKGMDSAGGGKVSQTYKTHFIESIKRTKKFAKVNLRQFIIDRTIRFAGPWYAKKAYDKDALSTHVTKTGVYQDGMNHFNTSHTKNEKSAAATNKLGSLVDYFIKMLDRKMP